MRVHQIKFKGKSENYSILIGENILNFLSKKIKFLCPKTKKIAVIIDKNIPKIFKIKLKKNLKNFNLVFMPFNANEKSKSIKTVNYYLEKLLLHNFNRSDRVIVLAEG